MSSGNLAVPTQGTGTSTHGTGPSNRNTGTSFHDHEAPARSTGMSAYNNATSTQNTAPSIRNSDEIVDLRELLRSIWSYKWSILLITLIAAITAYTYGNLKKPIYVATAEVLLQEMQQPVDLGALALPGGGIDKEVATEIEVIRSREILERVVERLGLTTDPEFNLFSPDTPPTLLERTGYWPIDVVSYFPPEILVGDEVQSYEATPQQILRVAIDSLERKTFATHLRDTTILLIRVEAWTAAKAAEIANVISDEYLKERVQVRVDAQKFATEFIGERVIEMRQDVELAEAEAQSFRSENAILEEDSSEVLRFEAMQNRVASVISRENTLKERLRQFDNAISSGARLSEAARLLDDRRVNALILSGYNEAAEERIRETVNRLRADISLVTERRAALQSSLTTLETSLKEEGGKLVRYRQLVREAEATRLLFETFLARQKETAAQQGLIKPDARILTFADPPYGPSRPRKRLILIIGTVLGLATGVALSLLRSMSNNTFTSIEELENASDLTVFGAVPNITNMSRRSNIFTYCIKKPNSVIVESVRNLRTSILLSNVDDPPKVVVVTSSVPEEGKSIATILLGLVTAQMGKRALVIDADLRRSTLHRTLKVKNDEGIISVLRGAKTFDEVVVKDVHENLDVLVVENNRVSATDLISSKAFQNLLLEAREKYDMIFLDAPPILAVTDARILAQHSDSLIYIVKWNKTPKDLVKRGIKVLNSSGIRVSGLAFGRFENKNEQYKYGNYYKSISKYYKS